MPGFTEASPNALRLSRSLEPLLASAGDFGVYGHILFNWFDRVRSIFQSAVPIVEVASGPNPSVKLHFGGAASPARSGEPALTLRELVEELRTLSENAASGPIYASLSFEASDSEATLNYVMNIPIRGVRVQVNQSKRRVLLHLLAAKGEAPSTA